MEQHLVSFDFQQFVERRFKLGRAQYLTLLALAMVEFNDGIQAITISLLTPILKEQLELSEGQVSFLTSIFYVGVGLGALISGIQANKHGRKNALLFGTFMQFISSVLLAYSLSYAWLCGCRLMYGIGFGSTLAVATVIITELMPMNIRGRTLLIISFLNSIGKLGGVGLAFLFINGDQKYVSQYMLTSAVINFVALVLVNYYVKQSFRFLLLKNDHAKSWRVMNCIIKQNDEQAEELTSLQKQSITNWSSNVFSTDITTKSSIKRLAECKRVAILLSISWFFINIIFFGEMFIIPFMLKSKSSGLIQYFWMTLGEVPSLLLTFTLIERKGWGRKTSIVSFFLGSGLLCLITIYFLNSFTLFFAKMLMKAVFQMLYPFTSESYPTSARSIGFALNSFVGRFGATIMPFVIYPLYNKHPNSPFLFLAVLCFFGAVAIHSIRKDTLLKPLDESQQESYSPKKLFYQQYGQEIQVSTLPDNE